MLCVVSHRRLFRGGRFAKKDALAAATSFSLIRRSFGGPSQPPFFMWERGVVLAFIA